MQHSLGQPTSLNILLMKRARLVRLLLFTVVAGLLSAFAPFNRAAILESGTSKATTLNAPELITAPHTTLQFYPDSVTVGGTSKIVILIDNTNDSNITGLQFATNLSAGIIVGASGASNYCGGTLTAIPNGTSFSLSNGTIAAHMTCVIYVDVVATTVGSWFNHTGIISSSNAPPGDDVGATLIVTNGALLPAPSVSTTFTPGSIAVGGYSRLSITLSNNDPVNAIVGAQLFDVLPAGLVTAPNSVVVGNTCSPSVYPDTNALRMYGAKIPGGGSCSVVIKVVGASVGSGTNQTGPVLSGNAVTAQGASAPFNVANVALLTAPSLASTFSSSPVHVGETSDLKLTLTNPNANAAVNGVQYLQEYPSGIVNAANGVIVGNTCGGTLVALPNGESVSLTGAMIPSGSSCSVTVRVTGLWANVYSVSSGIVYSGNANQAAPVLATLNVGDNPSLLNPPGVTKTFTPTTVEVGDASQMTIALSNPNATAITSAGFTDIYPPHMINGPSDAVSSNTCGGTISAPPNGSWARLNGGTIPPNGCSVVIDITATRTGAWPNHTGAVVSSNANPGMDASATLQVDYNAGGMLSAPAVTESFSPPTVPVGSTSEMTIALSNPNPSAITGIQLADTYPSGMVNASSGVVLSNSCGGSLAAMASGTSVSLSGGTVPANDACSIVVVVNAIAAGAHVNHTGVVTSANADFSADATATLTVTDVADLTLTKSHAGNFTQGQWGAVYSLIAHNPGAAATSAPVTVTDVLPASLTATSMSGPGWTCDVATTSCTRSDALAAGASYPAITLMVDVGGSAPLSATNNASVSGGGEINAANNAASDPTTIDIASPWADLTLTKSHAYNFGLGQIGAVYSLVAHNIGASGSFGTVTVTDVLPASLTATAMAGPGWACNVATTSCTRSDGLSAGLSYPAITLTVEVAGNAPASVTNNASVSGGGETNSANDAASDPTTIDSASAGPDLTLTKSHAGSFTQNQPGAVYSLIAHNIGSAATSGLVTVTDMLPASLTATAMSGPGWACNVPTKSCTRSDALPAGSSYPAITLSVDVASNAPGTVTNNASVSGGGQTNTANDAAGDPTTIDSASAWSDLTLTKSHVGNFRQGQTGAVYSLVAHNIGGSGSAGAVTVVDVLPASLTPTAMSGPGWTCSVATTSCTRNDALPAGSSYPGIALTVDVADNAPASVTNNASVSSGSESNTSNGAASDPTTIDPSGNSATPQSLAFTSTAPTDATVSGSTYLATATASSGLPVVLTIDGMSATVCTIDNGMVSFIGAGTCTIDANQDGDANFAPASEVQQSFAVATADGIAPQTLAFTSTEPFNATVAGPTYFVTATASSGLPVVLTIDGTSATVCTIDNGTVSFIGAGTCTIDANQGGNATFAPAPQAQQSFTVTSAGGVTTQTITFLSTVPTDATVAGSTYLATAMASSGLPVVLTLDGASATVCTINNGVVAFIGAGTCTIDANQGGDAAYAPAPQVQQSFAVASAGGVTLQTIAFTSTAPLNATVAGPTYLATATASSGLPVVLTIEGASATVCAINNGTVNFIGAGTCTIDANQGGDATFALAPQVQQSFVVASAGGVVAQTITFTSMPPLNATVAGPSYFATATASSGLPVVLTVEESSATVCTINNGIVAFIGAGTCMIDANQGGDANYSPAPQAQQVFAVASAGGMTPQTITFTSTAPFDATVAGSTYLATATASSGLPVVLTIDDTSAAVCMINHGTVSFIGTGMCTIDANQGGNSVYAPALQVQQSFTVSSDNGSPPTVLCVLPTQVYVVGDTVNLDLSVLFAAPAGQSLIYSADNVPASLSIVGSLLSGILQASDLPGSPYAASLWATTVPDNASAVEDVTFQVLPTGEIMLRNGFDDGAAQPCQ